MTGRRDTNRTLILGLVDVALTLVALYLATWTRLLVPWGVRLPWRFVVLPWPVYLMAALIWPFVLTLASAYAVRGHAFRQLSVEIRSLLLGVGLALFALAGALYFTYREVPRRLFFYFGIIDLTLLVLARVVDYLLRRSARRNGRASRLLIAGAGQLGEEIAGQIQRYGEDWRLIGFLDDRRSAECLAQVTAVTK